MTYARMEGSTDATGAQASERVPTERVAGRDALRHPSPSVPRPATATAWVRLNHNRKAYRWRTVPELRSATWSPDDQMPGSDRYRPPGPAFEVECWWPSIERYRAVASFEEIVEVWQVVREE